MKTASQNLQILRALRKGRKLTAMDALREFGCMRLGARVYELRTDYGVAIESKIITTPNGEHVSQYWLSKEERKRLVGKTEDVMAHHAAPRV